MRTLALSALAAPSLSTLVALSSCASQPITLPADHASATAEEAQARRDERAAGVLERQAAMEDGTMVCGPVFERAGGPTFCGPSPRRSGAAADAEKRASQLSRAAKRHREVSRALLQAEARACAGLPESEVVESPFARRDDIVGVEVLSGPVKPGGVANVLGARVRFHSLEAPAAAQLQHIVDCQLARDDALGHDVPGLSYCPLVPRGARATVTTLPHGYVIEVRSNDPAAAREIARRALALQP